MTRKVCWQCIGEDIVSAEIKAEQPRRICSYCGSRRPAIRIDDLAHWVDPVFQHIVGEAEPGFVVRDGNPDWAPDGEYPSNLMTEILEADTDEIGRDLVSMLAHQHRFDVNEGGFDYYDDTSDSYTILDAEDEWFRRGWESFCDELKHQRRFFLDQSTHVLDEIFGPILREEWPPGSAIRTIGPNTGHTHLFRARDANERGEQEKIYRQRRRQLGAPPPGVAGSGRMNAAGISVFYGSFDSDTCVAELRTPVGGYAIVGRFEILRPLRVLDLTLLEADPERLSYFDPHYAERVAYSAFMRGFHAEIRRAVIPGRETLEYLPTQVIAEYLWSRTVPGIDGIVFGSAQITDSANNVVLFPHAASVESADDETERTIRYFHHRPARTDEDADEDDQRDRDLITFEPQTAENAAAQAHIPNEEDNWLAELWEPVPPVPDPGPALRLGENDVWRIRVDGIRYVTHLIQAQFSDWEDHGLF
ncbi:RES domain-containing protein [Sphingobium sp. EP60837]|uniref:RES domain-containing protein n=1 Tax=Sphingobium sp. EP60837 TaxID=1855519 RepID=UPI0007DD1F72|nr:RES domain-containing protein [Sphingobium sp. EP60837]ANI80319.1 hypothetical protein EP837_03941 [Sphingobium sp. EP60837]